MQQGSISLSPQESHDQTQIAFTVIMAASAMVLSAALPLMTYLLLALGAINLYRSMKLWTEDANLAQPPTVEALDPPSKMILGGAVGLLGIFIVQLNPLSQVIICTFFAGGLAAFFVHECIYTSQKALDAALRTAAEKGELENVNALLNKHASPFAKDKQGNNAFYYAQKNRHADVLRTLDEQALKKPLSLKGVLATVKEFVNDDVAQKWHHLYHSIKNCILINSREHRAQCYEALNALFYAHGAPLQTFINTGVLYIREQLNNAHPKVQPVVMINAAKGTPSTPAQAASLQFSQPKRRSKRTNTAQSEPARESTVAARLRERKTKSNR